MRLRNKSLLGAGLIFGLALWFISSPSGLSPGDFEVLEGDLAQGELVFNIGGCASCHMAKEAEGEARFSLGGGQSFETPFGVFYAPNISPGKAGIGGWSALDLANALLKGISPEGAHYYPVFPYSSYARMEMQDIADLKAFLDTLPAVEQDNLPHELPLPFRIRRSLGFWKLLFLKTDPIVESTELRGQYLVEAIGHCAECHTPRNFLGGLDVSRWLAGAPNPEGKGRIPNLTPGGDLASWSAEDIAYYLETGFTPEFDTAGSTMVEVVENLARATPDDRLAIARYLKALPPLANAPRP